MKHYIMGKHVIEEVLNITPQRFIRVYSCKKDSPLLKALKKTHINTLIVSQSQLFSLVRSTSHQGFVAEVHARHFMNLQKFLSHLPTTSLVVMCDSIADPQNFGTILRACECFGVDALIFSKNRNVPITPVVSKASAGGSELVPLIMVSNLADTLHKFRNAGYSIVATKHHTQNLYTFTFPNHTLLIIGNEGKGIQTLLSKKADTHIAIPMYGKIESLNVSQATAVLLSHWKKGCHPLKK